ncbi:tigger transposable element-derived 1-like [Pelobates cultripes]|uniref:Tigger transposable element-derived 1-like n=1 Tax=Pelobates cultripes TaxID=61616 RepID=A0AAD1T7L5_PELCU|nr:tigger transposable element-derived 1-like [Pelobates cultripes]CAH2319104.1 tigger transposable element-derived 1-like [Pelobates cultripes]
MKEKISGRDAAKGVTRVSKQRPPVLEEVEKLLLLWIEQKQRAGDSVTKAIICEKAKALHVDLLKQQPGTSADAEGFKASREWFKRFKTRSGIHSVVRHGEAASSDAAAAEEFATEFLEVIVSEGYFPQQVFNCNETGLFWKRMPKPDEGPSHPPVLCQRQWGQIKPLLVYHSENPWAFKKHKVNKEQLSVLWQSNPKAWVTRLLFVKWVNAVFGPAVKKYLVDNNLPLKAMLLMDNAPAHPPGLEEDLLEDFNFIKVMFLPPNTTPLLQPMDQQIITIAWAGVSQTNLNSAWRNLWPDCVVKPASSASAPAPESTVLKEIVSLGRTMVLEVTEEDVYELVEEHDHDLTTEELVELQKEAM